jgi:hypothetical protein
MPCARLRVVLFPRPTPRVIPNRSPNGSPFGWDSATARPTRPGMLPVPSKHLCRRPPGRGTGCWDGTECLLSVRVPRNRPGRYPSCCAGATMCWHSHRRRLGAADQLHLLSHRRSSTHSTGTGHSLTHPCTHQRLLSRLVPSPSPSVATSLRHAWRQSGAGTGSNPPENRSVPGQPALEPGGSKYGCAHDAAACATRMVQLALESRPRVEQRPTSAGCPSETGTDGCLRGQGMQARTRGVEWGGTAK